MKLRVTHLVCLTSFVSAGFLLNAEPARAQAKGWCEEKRIVEDSKFDTRVAQPGIAVDGDRVFVAYRQQGIKLIASSDRGKTWSQPKLVSGNLTVCQSPAVAVQGNQVVVAWPALVEVEGLTAYQLFSVESSDGGASFAQPERIRVAKEDAFLPKFHINGNQAILAWMEIPLAQTLGRISTVAQPDFNVDDIEALFSSKIKAGSLEDRLKQVRSTIYTQTYNFSTSTFTAPVKIDLLYSQSVPHIFEIYGPIHGSLFITANENTQIRTFESTDGGRSWKRNYEDQSFFDSRRRLSMEIVDGERYMVWMRRDRGRLPINFRQGGSAQSDVQLSPEHYIRSTPELVYSDEVFHVAWEAGEGDNSWISYIRTDKVPPTSKITYPSNPSITGAQATFRWQGDDNISSTDRLVYAYTYDSQDWSQSSPNIETSFKAPPDGEYTFKVRAEDVAGNIQPQPAEFKFNTFLSAPNTKIVKAPPMTETIKSRTVEIAFSGEDNNDPADNLEYSLQADEGEWTAFQKAQTYTFTDLSNGSHTLRVRCKDTRGNVDSTPAETTVIIDVDLELILTLKPEISTNAETIDFEWEAKDDKGNPVQLTYYYQLNNGPVQEITQANQLQLSELEEGKHEIQIWGKDASGDETPKVAHSWLVDHTPPSTTATFTKEYAGRFPLILIQSSDPPLPDGSSTPIIRNYQYQINDGEWKDFESLGGVKWPAEEGLSFYALGYLLKIRAVDAAGNIDPHPAVVDMRIWVRTNPYIFYPIAGLLLIGILYLLKLIFGSLMSRGGGYRRRMPAASTASSSSFGMTGGTDSFSLDSSSKSEPTEPKSESKSTFNFDDEDDPYK